MSVCLPWFSVRSLKAALLAGDVPDVPAGFASCTPNTSLLLRIPPKALVFTMSPFKRIL